MPLLCDKYFLSDSQFALTINIERHLRQCTSANVLWCSFWRNLWSCLPWRFCRSTITPLFKVSCFRCLLISVRLLTFCHANIRAVICTVRDVSYWRVSSFKRAVTDAASPQTCKYWRKYKRQESNANQFIRWLMFEYYFLINALIVQLFTDVP